CKACGARRAVRSSEGGRTPVAQGKSERRGRIGSARSLDVPAAHQTHRMGGPMHRRTRFAILLAAVVSTALVGPAVAGSETPTIEARSTIAWKPPSVTIGPAGE